MTVPFQRGAFATLPLFAVLLLGCQSRSESDAAAGGTQARSDTAAVDDAATAAGAGDAERAGHVVVADVGFEGPESVLHDATADRYLVSNVNGDPFAKDDNGFISRLTPDGTVEELKWIDGADDAVTLHAPKGLALHGDTLFAADVDGVRMFDRTSGRQLGTLPVAGVSLLNDLATGPDGKLYATDTGVRPGTGGFEPAGTDALYRFDGTRAVAVARGEQLGHPNGVAVDAEGPVVVTFGTGQIFRVGDDGTLRELAKPPTGQLDGVVLLDDGGMIVTSWEGKTTYHITPAGEVHNIWPDFEAPADIGFDKGRSRMLLPSLSRNRVEFAVTH